MITNLDISIYSSFSVSAARDGAHQPPAAAAAGRRTDCPHPHADSRTRPADPGGRKHLRPGRQDQEHLRLRRWIFRSASSKSLLTAIFLSHCSKSCSTPIIRSFSAKSRPTTIFRSSSEFSNSHLSFFLLKIPSNFHLSFFLSIPFLFHCLPRGPKGLHLRDLDCSTVWRPDWSILSSPLTRPFIGSFPFPLLSIAFHCFPLLSRRSEGSSAARP